MEKFHNIRTMFQVESIGVEEFFSRLENLLEDRFGSGVPNAHNSQPQQSASNNNEWLSRKEVAQRLKKSTGTVDNWSKAGILTPYKMGRMVFFKNSEVESAPVAKKSNK